MEPKAHVPVSYKPRADPSLPALEVCAALLGPCSMESSSPACPKENLSTETLDLEKTTHLLAFKGPR